MILAGDIGGTKTHLALFKGQEFDHLKTFPSKDYESLRKIVKEYLESVPSEGIELAVFAIAGPVKNGVCKTTNLPWVVDAPQLAKDCGLPAAALLNDLEANAFAIEILEKDQLTTLHPGKNGQGNRAVVSPGTGLGEAGLFWDGDKHHPFPSEGGHCEFGPRNELQIDLCRYLLNRFGHSSYERVLSGPGLHNIFQFYLDVQKRQQPGWLAAEMKERDPAYVITEHALKGNCEVCSDTLDLFVSILGSEASNCALKYMALGGVFLGGGIPPKILPRLQTPAFLEGFVDKGRFRPLLEEVPIAVILDQKAALRGAAHFGSSHLPASKG